MSTAAAIIQTGLLADRPAATTYRAGVLYLATDDTPPTVYRCDDDGGGWTAYATVAASASDVGAQPLDADLTTIAGLTATTDNMIQSVGSAWASRTPSQVRTALALVPGTDIEAHDADLTTIAGLSPTNDDVLQRKAGAWANRTMAQVKTDLSLAKGDVGLGNVDNTSNATERAAAATLTNKTLTAPVIADFTNAAHDHLDADDGGTLDAAAIASGVLAIARLATGTPTGSKFVRDDGTLAVPAGSGMTNPMTTAADLIVGDTGGAPIRLAKGSDGQVLTVDPTTHLLVWATPSAGGAALTVEEVDGSPTDSAITKIVFPNGTLGIASHVATYTPSGGGGNVTGTGAYGSEPGSPASGDLYLPNDSPVEERYSGSAWVGWGPRYPLTKPIDGDYAWINQGGASVSAAKGLIFLSAPASSGDSLAIRKKAAPSTPYTITMMFLLGLGSASGCYGGPVFRESSTGKLITFHFQINSSGIGINFTKWNSATSFNAHYTASGYFATLAPIILRIADNGTNLIASYSGDGVNFVQFESRARGNFFTSAPNEVGFFGNAGGAAAWGISLLSWAEA